MLLSEVNSYLDELSAGNAGRNIDIAYWYKILFLYTWLFCFTKQHFSFEQHMIKPYMCYIVLHNIIIIYFVMLQDVTRF